MIISTYNLIFTICPTKIYFKIHIWCLEMSVTPSTNRDSYHKPQIPDVHADDQSKLVRDDIHFFPSNFVRQNINFLYKIFFSKIFIN